MQIENCLWTVEDLIGRKERINLNPTWQRGPAWKLARQVLLIDSILRGMDFPKLYLRRLPVGGHDFDAVDGQQRLRTIWMFAADEFRLEHTEPLAPVNGVEIAGRLYSELPPALQEQFKTFTASVAEISSSDNGEITGLFSRLQMGVPLVPAELRNAMLGPMRHTIDAIATSHVFFTESRIPEARYKRQDFVTHAFAMVAYEGDQDIKAPTLKAMVRDIGADRMEDILEYARQVGDSLNILAEVNRLTNRMIEQKWIFVDLCWLVIQRQKAGAVVSPVKLAAAYSAFEKRRRQHNSEPERLIRGRNPPALDRHLYRYIGAFRAQGATRENLALRNAALDAYCPDIEQP